MPDRLQTSIHSEEEKTSILNICLEALMFNISWRDFRRAINKGEILVSNLFSV